MEEKEQTAVKQEATPRENKAPGKAGRKLTPLLLAAAALALVVLAVAALGIGGKIFGGAGPTVMTTSTLEKIINVSSLSTYTAVYNGVAEVRNEDEPEEIDYYVSYEARIKAGFDFSEVGVRRDDENSTIYLDLPEVTITEVNVDISSLDFIFVNKKADTSTVTSKAYAACEEDAERESEAQSAIRELAEQNAQNVMIALVEPLLGQTDLQQYKVVVE